MAHPARLLSAFALSGLLLVADLAPALSGEDQPAKQAFGAVQLPTAGPATPYGFYSKGCMSGAVALPTDGPNWQAMRLSRNRRWGNPAMISLLEQLSRDAPKVGWPGLLVGDIAQPRGGPMVNGHASHQLGLDADVWLTPMPAKRLSVQQREDKPFVSMLQKDKFLTIDEKAWTPAHARLLMLAASYPQVERIFVNPAIKKKLCDSWTGDRAVMGKIRPLYGHDAHFHIRISCPAGAAGCKPQAPVAAGDGCDKSLAWWFTKEPWEPKKPATPTKPAPPPRPMMVSDLPKACAAILDQPAVVDEAHATYGGVAAYVDPGPVPVSATAKDLAPKTGGAPVPEDDVPLPAAR
ncbi:penicillin-insensitive murein endopeptidase [Allorhizobium undicola]|uniref:penicillin-insensitive murein endopeptidase n=1 Tax=Allorhizobium undicola TaxID=78527 RepID=UPI00048738AE